MVLIVLQISLLVVVVKYHILELIVVRSLVSMESKTDFEWT